MVSEREQALTGVVEDRRGRNSGRQFQRRYRSEDIRLLAEVDEAFGQMSGLATCAILRREYRVHGDSRFLRLAARFAEAVDDFTREQNSPFLNFHRPCLYATEHRDPKGKARRTGTPSSPRPAPKDHTPYTPLLTHTPSPPSA